MLKKENNIVAKFSYSARPLVVSSNCNVLLRILGKEDYIKAQLMVP